MGETTDSVSCLSKDRSSNSLPFFLSSLNFGKCNLSCSYIRLSSPLPFSFMLWGHFLKLPPMFPDTCYLSMRVCSVSMAMFTRMVTQIILSDYYVTSLGKHVYVCGEGLELMKMKKRKTGHS